MLVPFTFWPFWAKNYFANQLSFSGVYELKYDTDSTVHEYIQLQTSAKQPNTASLVADKPNKLKRYASYDGTNFYWALENHDNSKRLVSSQDQYQKRIYRL